MKDVLILMSTYNGEKYLSEQIDSILSQKDISLHLLIRDDGSSDSTVSIIEHYKSLFPSLINVVKGNNIGWKKSFFTLMQIAERDYPCFNYFAFADQDDIWLPNKLNRGIGMLSKPEEEPQLYCSNLIYYKEGRESGLIRNKAVNPSYKNCLIRNYAVGCTVIFNKSLLQSAIKEIPRIPIAHDYWVYLIATLCGTVVVDPQALILYRQHEENQIGSNRRASEIWKRRLRSFSYITTGHNKENLANELLRIHGNRLNIDAKSALLKVARYRVSFQNRIKLLFDNGYTFNKTDSDFWLKIRIIFGKL